MAKDALRAAPLAMRPQGRRGRWFGVVMERLNARAYRAALAADPGEVLAADDLEAQAEATLHLALPLEADRGRADDQDQIEA